MVVGWLVGCELGGRNQPRHTRLYGQMYSIGWLYSPTHSNVPWMLTRDRSTHYVLFSRMLRTVSRYPAYFRRTFLLVFRRISMAVLIPSTIRTYMTEYALTSIALYATELDRQAGAYTYYYTCYYDTTLFPISDLVGYWLLLLQHSTYINTTPRCR